jgi:hypothetical protein
MTPPTPNLQNSTEPDDRLPASNRGRKDETRPEASSPWILVRVLEAWFPALPRPVQSLMALTILALLVIYVLNGFIARTYVRGTLWILDAENNQFRGAGYPIVLDGRTQITDHLGNWIFTIPRGGVPGKLTFQMEARAPAGEGPLDARVMLFNVWGPIPVYHGIGEMNYDVYMYPDKKGPERIRVAEASSPLLNLWPAKRAWNILGLAAEATEAPKSSSIPDTPRDSVPVAFEFLMLRLSEDVKLPSKYGWPVSSFRVYLRVVMNGRTVPDRTLLGTRESSISRSLQLPVESVPDSWIPVKPGGSYKFGGIFGNASSLFSEGRGGLLMLRGNLELQVCADGDVLARFRVPQTVGVDSVVTLNDRDSTLTFRLTR